MISTIEKPTSQVWKNAKRYKARFFESKYPLCGTYVVYAVIGRKWVRISQGDLVLPDKSGRHQLPRFRMSVREWDKLPVRYKYDDRDMAVVASDSCNN